MIDARGIDNVLFAVGDLAEAERFYGEALPGLMIREQPDLAPGPARETPRVWLEVPDALAGADALYDAGVRPLSQPRQMRSGWFVEVADPWGNVVGLVDYRNDPARARGGG